MSYKNCWYVSGINFSVMKILILHGPNMNLLGIRSSKIGTNVTLDKVNRALRIQIRKKDIELKIFQTHNEAKAVTFVQRNRKRTSGVLISPTSWHKGGFTLSDTLHFLEIPYCLE